MEFSAIWPPLVGGMLIGLATLGVLLLNGRVAGISGIFGGVLSYPNNPDWHWRAAFIGGLVLGGIGLYILFPGAYPTQLKGHWGYYAVAGLLVGFGTRLGSGCTSGHGVCGNSRFSPRSIVATVTFIGAGAITVLVVKAMGGVS